MTGKKRYAAKAIGSLFFFLAVTVPVDAERAFITELLSLRAGGDSTLVSGAAGLTTDYLGGEALVAPREGDTTLINGSAHTWVRVQQPDGQWEVGGDQEQRVAYWTFSVLSFTEQDVKLRYRHEGGLRVWAYGSLVIDDAQGSGMQQESQTIHLQNGVTRFLFKALKQNADAFFEAELTSPDGQPISYIANFDRGGVPAGGIITLLWPPSYSSSEIFDASFAVGQTMTVQWVIERNRLDAGVVIEVSIDNGKNWTSLMNDPLEKDDPVYHGGSDTGAYDWTIPETVVATDNEIVELVADGTAQIRVWSQYATGTPADRSGRFSITPRLSAIRAPRTPGRETRHNRKSRAILIRAHRNGWRMPEGVLTDAAGKRYHSRTRARQNRRSAARALFQKPAAGADAQR